MPKILLVRGFRFFFYSNENNEPAHIHISRGDGTGKIWLEPSFAVAYFKGFTVGEQKEIVEIAMENIDLFKLKWNEYFKQ